jgi:hypothetical protein
MALAQGLCSRCQSSFRWLGSRRCTVAEPMTGLTVGILVRCLDDADAVCCLVGGEPVRDCQACVNGNVTFPPVTNDHHVA